jgi:hypothetical protein
MSGRRILVKPLAIHFRMLLRSQASESHGGASGELIPASGPFKAKADARLSARDQKKRLGGAFIRRRLFEHWLLPASRMITPLVRPGPAVIRATSEE